MGAILIPTLFLLLCELLLIFDQVLLNQLFHLFTSESLVLEVLAMRAEEVETISALEGLLCEETLALVCDFNVVTDFAVDDVLLWVDRVEHSLVEGEFQVLFEQRLVHCLSKLFMSKRLFAHWINDFFVRNLARFDQMG